MFIIVRKHTVVARPILCPELALFLVTDACPLWTATDRQLREHGIVDPYWAFCWAGGQALARHVLDHPKLVRDRTVLDFGAGCGVVAIASALAGARATAVDVDPVAAEAIALNAKLNGVEVEVLTDDLIGAEVPHDVVLVGDVSYERALTERMMPWLVALDRPVLIGDPGRGHLTRWSTTEVASYEAPADVGAGHTVTTTIHLIR